MKLSVRNLMIGILINWPINVPGHLSSHSPLICRLVVASPVVMCLRLVSPFVAQPPHASILDPPLFVLASWLLRHKYSHHLRL